MMLRCGGAGLYPNGPVETFVCVCAGAPVAVGMSIDVASIDMVSEVNMVRGLFLFVFFPLCLLHRLTQTELAPRAATGTS